MNIDRRIANLRDILSLVIDVFEALLDGLIVLLATGLAAGLVVVYPEGSTVRALAGLPLLFFFPGYAVTMALFPARRVNDGGFTGRTWVSSYRQWITGDTGIDATERLALAVGASVCLLPIVSVGLALVNVAVTLPIRLVVLSGIVLFGTVTGLGRRLWLPADRQFRLRLRAWLGPVLRGTDGSISWGRTALAAVVLLVAAVSVVGLSVAIVAPPSGESHSTLMVLTEDEEGDFVAGGYPSEMPLGEPTPLVVGVKNNEGTSMEYTVVPVFQRVDAEGDNIEVLNRQQLAPIPVSAEAGQTVYIHHEVTPQISGQDVRLVYLLFRGEPTDDLSTDTAYRHVHIWTEVTE